MQHPASTQDWIQILFSEPVVDLTRLKQRLTDHDAIQTWLPEASLRAVEGLGEMDAAGMSMYAYSNLMSEFEQHFPALFDAVNEATAGCGRVVVNWRPTDLQYSTVGIEFGTEQEMLVLLRCNTQACTPDDLSAFLNLLSESLPKGTPFPRRPDRVSGVVSTQDGCVYVQLVVENTGRQIQRYAMMRFPGADAPQKVPANAVMLRLEAALFGR